MTCRQRERIGSKLRREPWLKLTGRHQRNNLQLNLVLLPVVGVEEAVVVEAVEEEVPRLPSRRLLLLQQPGTAPPFANSYVDVNKDGKVDSVDFSILLYQWKK